MNDGRLDPNGVRTSADNPWARRAVSGDRKQIDAEPFHSFHLADLFDRRRVKEDAMCRGHARASPPPRSAGMGPPHGWFGCIMLMRIVRA